MPLKLTINTENSAFDEDAGVEVARIMRDVARRIESGEMRVVSKLFDANGNHVGYFEPGDAFDREEED